MLRTPASLKTTATAAPLSESLRISTEQLTELHQDRNELFELTGSIQELDAIQTDLRETLEVRGDD